MTNSKDLRCAKLGNRSTKSRSAMLHSRRRFLQSLTRTGIVLSLEQVLASVRPSALFGQSTPARKQVERRPEAPLGVAFVDVAQQAGLKVKTIFGGEKKNK